MRPTQKQNRTRGRGNRKPNSGNNLNRVFESNGPEGKVRGTPQQIVEKYLSLARDAQTSDDRVVAENFLQHAEHYQRILLEGAPNSDERRDHPSEQNQPDVESMDNDVDSRAEPERRSPQMEVVRTDSDADQRGERSDRRPDRRDSDRHGDRSGNGRPRHSADVGGLTTIDSGDGDSHSLLVEAEDLSASQPRRRPRTPAPDRQPIADRQPFPEPQPSTAEPGATQPTEMQPVPIPAAPVPSAPVPSADMKPAVARRSKVKPPVEASSETQSPEADAPKAETPKGEVQPE